MNRIEVCTENYGNASAIDIDVRGSREKFWFSFNDSPNQKWLFKNTNKLGTNKKTFEDIGEVIFYEICEQVGVKCALYAPAISVKDGVEKEGVISANYNPLGFQEFSGYSILEYYKNFAYDNYHGLNVDSENTLDNYLHALKCFAATNRAARVDVDKIMTEMGKRFLLDYLCIQSDRNWYNVSFLLDNSSCNFDLSPCFDNGNIFCWNFKSSVIEHLNKLLSNKNKISYLNEFLKSKPIAMGVKTCMSLHNNETPHLMSRLPQTEDSITILENEMVDMILKSKELQDFLFNKLGKENNIIDKAFFEAENKYGKMPELLHEQANRVFNLRCEHLTNLVKQAKKLKEQEEMNEYFV